MNTIGINDNPDRGRIKKILAAIAGMHTSLGEAFCTMFLSFGNAFSFGGLLCTLPSEEKFEAFRKKVEIK